MLRSARILVVSQDESLLRTAASVLKRARYLPAITRRAPLALRLAPGFDLLVVDLAMRPLAGDDLVSQLRARGAAVPAVILAGRSTETWARLLRIPRVMALAKPLTAVELTAAVEAALDRWQRRVA